MLTNCNHDDLCINVLKNNYLVYCFLNFLDQNQATRRFNTNQLLKTVACGNEIETYI